MSIRDRILDLAALLVLCLLFSFIGRLAFGEELYCGLPVVEEADVGCTEPYDGKDYRYNADRLERLVAERMGGLFAPYTNRVPDSLKDTDYEHVVARSEAHASGACHWKADARRTFANDPLNGVLAYPHVNRVEKRAKDAGEWMPRWNQRYFALRVLRVKQRYGLSVDPREAKALSVALGGRCP